MSSAWLLQTKKPLLQAFFNPTSTAADALEEVGRGKRMISTRHVDSKAIVEFSDTGPGIKSPQHVFDPIFATKSAGKATGLGPSICYGIVQDHGGRITRHNRPEGGPTFVVEFPLSTNGNRPRGDGCAERPET